MPSQQMRLIALAPERQNVNLALNAAAIYASAALVIEAFGLRATGLAARLAALMALGNLWLGARVGSRT